MSTLDRDSNLHILLGCKPLQNTVLEEIWKSNSFQNEIVSKMYVPQLQKIAACIVTMLPRRLLHFLSSITGNAFLASISTKKVTTYGVLLFIILWKMRCYYTKAPAITK